MLAGLGIPGAADDARAGRAAAGFDGLPSRFRSLGRVGGVEFVDDGLSTNVLPAQAALAAFADRPVALLVGGHDRGVDYEPLGRTVARGPAPTLVVTMPDNGPRIGEAVRGVSDGRVEVVDADDLDAAVDGRVRVGAAPVASSCCRRPRRASGASATIGSGRPPSPRRRRGADRSAERVSRRRRRAPAPRAR